jgi:pimeloyl-ACP methyl ester carboxylesterase
LNGGIFITADGCRLAYDAAGDGSPVLWQHGLGADHNQPAEVFPSLPGICRITLECRGHGASELGDPGRLSIACFVMDALALLDHLEIDQAVAGGISLGAAIALRMAALYPSRVSGLILGRPAWVDGPPPETMAAYLEVARLLKEFGAVEGARRFERSQTLAAIEAVSPDNAGSLRWFFTRPNPESTIALLSRIPRDTLGISGEMFKQIRMPTLIVANAQDYVHPLVYAERLQALLPHAVARTITSKTVDRDKYVVEFRHALAEFLTRLEMLL